MCVTTKLNLNLPLFVVLMLRVEYQMTNNKKKIYKERKFLFKLKGQKEDDISVDFFKLKCNVFFMSH